MQAADGITRYPPARFALTCHWIKILEMDYLGIRDFVDGASTQAPGYQASSLTTPATTSRINAV